MFKNALVYRMERWDAPSLTDIDSRLATAPFVACGATQPESSGFIPPRGDKHAALVESVGGQIVLRICTETKAVPGGVVKTQVQAELDKIEAETGHRPKGKRAKEVKEAVVHALMPRAFPKRSETLVWIDPIGQVVWVGAGSVKKADAVVTRLIELLGTSSGGLKLSLIQTELAPATAMAHWLQSQEAPSGFSIDRDCELKQPDSEKATVRYARHTLDIAEVGEHIAQGKLPTQLALTWAGRVSFVLTEALTLKKIELLDVVLEGAGVDAANQGRNEGGFEADVAIATGELRQLLPALVEALGGLHVRQPAAPAADANDPAAATAAATASGASPQSAASVAPWDEAAAVD